MTKIIAAVLACAFGTAYALPIVPHPSEKSNAASAASAQQASAQNRSESLRPDNDEDEAAPPVPIHHANSSRKKSAKRLTMKKSELPTHPKRYSLLLPN